MDRIKTTVEDHADQAPADGLTESARKSREWRAKRKGAGSASEREEVSTLILTVFVLGVAAVDVPEEVKPERDELAAVAERLTNILARHNLLLGKLSGDALDVVAIIAVGAGWYSRVAPDLRRLRGSNGPGSGGGGRGPTPGPVDGPAPARSGEFVSAISQADAATGQWLEGQLKEGNGPE